jgi:hypothetical protein
MLARTLQLADVRTYLADQLLADPVRSGSGERGLVDVARLVWRFTGDRDLIGPAVRRLLGNGIGRMTSRAGSCAGKQITLASEIGDPSLVQPLRERRDGEPRSAAAALALWRLTGDATGLAEALVPVLTRQPPSPGWLDAAEVLTTLGAAAAPALPTLRELADSDRCPCANPDMESPTARGIGHKDERFVTVIRQTIAAIAPHSLTQDVREGGVRSAVHTFESFPHPKRGTISRCPPEG